MKKSPAVVAIQAEILKVRSDIADQTVRGKPLQLDKKTLGKVEEIYGRYMVEAKAQEGEEYGKWKADWARGQEEGRGLCCWVHYPEVVEDAMEIGEDEEDEVMVDNRMDNKFGKVDNGVNLNLMGKMVREAEKGKEGRKVGSTEVEIRNGEELAHVEEGNKELMYASVF